MSTHKEKNLYYLDELSDYKVADHHKDVRGWKVLDSSGRKIGKVHDLLVNKRTEQVVYLDVEVDPAIISANHKPYAHKGADGVHEFLNKDGDDHLIIPIGLASLDLDKEIVSTENVDYNTFAETKRMRKGWDVDRDYELNVLNSYNRYGDANSYNEDDDFYDRDEFYRR